MAFADEKKQSELLPISACSGRARSILVDSGTPVQTVFAAVVTDRPFPTADVVALRSQRDKR